MRTAMRELPGDAGQAIPARRGPEPGEHGHFMVLQRCASA